MKATEVKKKIKELKTLLNEYSTIKATINFIEKDKMSIDIVLDVKIYIENLKKRLVKIETEFDNLLK
jgi:hypothetical protein